MFDTHERILQKLAETGQKEFSAGMIKEAMDKVEDEEIDTMYQDWLKYHEPGSEAATEDLSDFPELKDSHDMEMEL